MIGGHVFHHAVSIRMSTNCVPPLTGLFIYTHKADLVQWLLKKSEKKLAWSLNFRYIDDAISLSNYKFGDFVVRIHPK